MGKPDEKQMLKRKKQLESEILNLERRIAILEREHREIINYLDSNHSQEQE